MTVHHDAELVRRLDPGPEAPLAGRRAVDALQGHVPPGLLPDLRLVVSELVTNSVRHSGATDPGTIDLVIRVHPDRVLVSVRDPGPGFVPPVERDPLRQGRWGLMIVDRLAERWEIKAVPENGTEVTAEMALRSA